MRISYESPKNVLSFTFGPAVVGLCYLLGVFHPEAVYGNLWTVAASLSISVFLGTLVFIIIAIFHNAREDEND